jgi:hypothetical protein
MSYLRCTLFLVPAGLGSALLAVTIRLTPHMDMLSVAFFFGLAMAVYFAIYENYSLDKLAAFISGSAVAYPAGLFSAVGLALDAFPVEGSMGSAVMDIPMPVFFLSGWVGAFIVSGAAILMFGRPDSQSLGILMLLCLAGGFLGAIGGEADRVRTHGHYYDFFLLYFVWQTVMAVLLGLVVPRVARNSTGVRVAE